MPCTGPIPKNELIRKFVDLLFNTQSCLEDKVVLFKIKYIEDCARQAQEYWYGAWNGISSREMAVMAYSILASGIKDKGEFYRILLDVDFSFDCYDF